MLLTPASPTSDTNEEITLLTPASPSSDTGEITDSDDLVLELRSFLATADTSSDKSLSIHNRNADTALSLLRRLPEAKEGHKNLIIKVLKIFPFVPLSKEMSVSFMHKAAHTFVQALMILIEDINIIEEEVKLQCIHKIIDVLAHIAYAHSFGLPMVLRFLLEAAIKSPFAAIFGGKPPQKIEFDTSTDGIMNASKTLFEENLAIETMPSHPVGSSSFHAGAIGAVKRRRIESKVSPEAVQSNMLMFVSLLFKLCNHHLSVEYNKEPDSAREKSKDATKQLALLLVDMISPDVMYNGLPWPEEEFTRITIERDLVIVKTFENQPILWRIMFGLAEARPSLCYCSVLIRAMFAVQMFYWQNSIFPRAEYSQERLEQTKNIVNLMSIGQFIPPPLDSISEVMHVMHPFHLYCILVDVWNYMRDNVPTPVAFSSNAEGVLKRDFEPYKNYKAYCERFRLVMIQHITELSNEYKSFFVSAVNDEEK